MVFGLFFNLFSFVSLAFLSCSSFPCVKKRERERANERKDARVCINQLSHLRLFNYLFLYFICLFLFLSPQHYSVPHSSVNAVPPFCFFMFIILVKNKKKFNSSAPQSVRVGNKQGLHPHVRRTESVFIFFVLMFIVICMLYTHT